MWKDRAFSDQAAAALKITGKDLIDLELADEIIQEPIGGAHSNKSEAAKFVKSAILKHLKELKFLTNDAIKSDRYKKFRQMGRFDGEIN